MKENIIWPVIGILDFIFVLCVAGGMEWGAITFKTGIICFIIALLILSICVYKSKGVRK